MRAYIYYLFRDLVLMLCDLHGTSTHLQKVYGQPVRILLMSFHAVLSVSVIELALDGLYREYREPVVALTLNFDMDAQI